ncbi:MAG: hypothetical protein ACRCXD_16395 [Luteolibacter sp.]
MTPPKISYHQAPDLPSSVVREDTIEYGFIGTLQKLKYGARLSAGVTELSLVV